MFAAEFFEREFSGQPVMAILRGYGPVATVELAGRAWDAGITCVEIPLQTPDDLDALTATVEAARERGLHVGAGTILTVQDVAAAKAAGAAFTVSPGFDQKVVAASIDAGLPPLPGVASATEIQLAIGQGLSWVKMFPAVALGVDWITGMLGPFPRLRIVATGGMDASNSQLFLDAGADVVAIGSAFGDIGQLPRIAALSRPSPNRE